MEEGLLDNPVAAEVVVEGCRQVVAEDPILEEVVVYPLWLLKLDADLHGHRAMCLRERLDERMPEEIRNLVQPRISSIYCYCERKPFCKGIAVTKQL